MCDKIFTDVKKYFEHNDGEATKIAHFPFRKRSEHIWRVFTWAKRLMDEGNQAEQSFSKTYRHIENFSLKLMQNNPMVTAKAKEYWESKQKLVKEFTQQLAFDLALDDQEPDRLFVNSLPV